MNTYFYLALTLSVIFNLLLGYGLVRGAQQEWVANRPDRPRAYWLNTLFQVAYAVFAVGWLIAGLRNMYWTGEFTPP